MPLTPSRVHAKHAARRPLKPICTRYGPRHCAAGEILSRLWRLCKRASKHHCTKEIITRGIAGIKIGSFRILTLSCDGADRGGRLTRAGGARRERTPGLDSRTRLVCFPHSFTVRVHREFHSHLINVNNIVLSHMSTPDPLHI